MFFWMSSFMFAFAYMLKDKGVFVMFCHGVGSLIAEVSEGRPGIAAAHLCGFCSDACHCSQTSAAWHMGCLQILQHCKESRYWRLNGTNKLLVTFCNLWIIAVLLEYSLMYSQLMVFLIFCVGWTGGISPLVKWVLENGMHLQAWTSCLQLFYRETGWEPWRLLDLPGYVWGCRDGKLFYTMWNTTLIVKLVLEEPIFHFPFCWMMSNYFDSLNRWNPGLLQVSTMRIGDVSLNVPWLKAEAFACFVEWCQPMLVWDRVSWRIWKLWVVVCIPFCKSGAQGYLVVRELALARSQKEPNLPVLMLDKNCGTRGTEGKHSGRYRDWHHLGAFTVDTLI